MRWCVCLAAGVPPGLPAIGRLLINYKHWPHLGPPGPPTSCQPAAARARRRASPALGTVHLALCRCHVIPHCTGCHLTSQSQFSRTTFSAWFRCFPFTFSAFLCSCSSSHVCFSSFLPCYHAPHAPVLCLPPPAAAFERAAVHLSGLAAPLGRILPPHTAWSVLHVHPAPVFPDPIPAQSTLRSGVAPHCVPSGATLSS